MTNLCLKNNEGKVVRLIPVDDTDKVLVVRAADDQRLVFRPAKEQELLKAEGWEILKEFTCEQALKSPISLTSQLVLGPCDAEEEVILDAGMTEEDNSNLRRSTAATILFTLLFMVFLFSVPTPEPEKMEEKVRQQVVKIVQVKQPEPVKVERKAMVRETRVTQQPTQPQPKTTQSIKRMGALAALGSATNSKQNAGLDLGAVQTSAGPGLGGTEGSGGTQTSLYGKGIISAPVGVGGNLKGAGGYGTKGKGGGQAGYGSLSLVGSSGASAIPVGEEVIAGGGLDQSLIWDVIRKNSGQIRFCYEQGLQSDPNLKGRVVTDFSIGANGQVTTLKIANSTINSKIVEDCISLRIKSWKFPLPEGGKTVSVKVPFNLNRQGRG